MVQNVATRAANTTAISLQWASLIAARRRTRLNFHFNVSLSWNRYAPFSFWTPCVVLVSGSPESPSLPDQYPARQPTKEPNVYEQSPTGRWVTESYFMLSMGSQILPQDPSVCLKEFSARPFFHTPRWKKFSYHFGLIQPAPTHYVSAGVGILATDLVVVIIAIARKYLPVELIGVKRLAALPHMEQLDLDRRFDNLLLTNSPNHSVRVSCQGRFTAAAVPCTRQEIKHLAESKESQI